MSYKINEAAVKEIYQIISNHSRKPVHSSTLSRINQLLYFNGKSGDIKASDYSFIRKPFIDCLVASYKIQDKSIFLILKDVAEKINDGYNEKLLYSMLNIP